MNEILLNVLSVVITTIVLPLITLIGTKLTQWISNKIKNEKASKNLTDATNIVTNAVRCVFQTYVDTLKKEGNFNADSQKKAFNQAKDIVLRQLSTDGKNYIQQTFGDINQWINTQIESSINQIKEKE